MYFKSRRLTAQPFASSYTFSPTSSHADEISPEGNQGLFLVVLTVNGIKFGFYDTGLATNESLFKQRRSLIGKISRFESAIDDAHTHLEPKRKLIHGGEMLELAKQLFTNPSSIVVVPQYAKPYR